MSGQTSPTKDYAYYPGCSQSASSVEYDRSVRACCQALGVNLAEVEDWSCCGSSPAHMVDHVLSGALAARNLARVAAMRRSSLATPCPSCLSALRTADHRMRDETFKAKVNALLDEPCETRVECKSILQVLIEDVGVEAMAAKAARKLDGLVAAPYYGCLMSRPPEIMTFDDTENPTSMDRVITGLGASLAPFPLKTDCCGASLGVPRREIVLTLSGKILAAAEAAGANVVIVACPLCHMNLDLRRDQINAFTGKDYRMPVLYITQLIGLALGLDRKRLGLDMHAVDPNPLLDSCFNSNRLAEQTKGADTAGAAGSPDPQGSQGSTGSKEAAR